MSDNNKDEIVKTHTYYGEYSLDHWLKLIKTGNLKMPEYQREFVWKNQQINELYDSFERNIFIPPIIIVRKNNQNYVLDGQQRLTSIVLMYKQKLATDIKDLKETFWENWENIDDASKYKSNDKNNPIKVINDKFAQSKQLGFSFILISEKEEKADQYFASIFYRINSKGTPLNYKQKMEALKFISPNYKCFIFPEIFDKRKIKGQDFDILRYLVFLSIYVKDKKLEKFHDVTKSRLDAELDTNKSNKNQFGYDTNIPTDYLETLYYDYMTALACVHPISGNLFSELGNWKDIIDPIRRLTNDQIDGADGAFDKIQKCLELKNAKANAKANFFSTGIEADLYCFGIIYYLMIEKKDIVVLNNNTSNIVRNDLQKAIDEFKAKSHTRKLNSINHILARIERSIEIWKPVFFKYRFIK